MLKKLSKKKNLAKVFLRKFELIQAALIVFGVFLSCTLVYFVSKWVYLMSLLNYGKETAGSVKADGVSPCIPPWLSLLFISCLLFYLIFAVLVPAIVSCARKVRALNNYRCFPLAEDEVRSFGFASAGEYFNYVVSAMYYGNREKGKKDWVNYVQLDTRDLQKMLAVCLKLFPNNGTIFDMEKDSCSCICNMYCSDFVKFLDAYHKTYENDKSYLPSASINEIGNVILSVLNADGHGIAWTGREMYVFTEENE